MRRLNGIIGVIAALMGIGFLFHFNRPQGILTNQTTVNQISLGLTASTPSASQEKPSPISLTTILQEIAITPTVTKPLWREGLLEPYGSPPPPPTITPIPTLPPPTLIATPTPAILLETDALRLELTSNGQVQGIIDKATSENHVADPGPYHCLYPFMWAVHENQSLYPREMWMEGDNLITKLGCYTPSITVTLRVERFTHFLTFEVVDIQEISPDELLCLATFSLNSVEEQIVGEGVSIGIGPGFALGIIALNNQVETYPDTVRGEAMVSAFVWRPSRIRGAKVAVLGVPPSQVADIIREILGNKL